MSGVAAKGARSARPGQLGDKIRARIGSLCYLPTTLAVAMKCFELGKDPDAGPREYANVLSADSSLSAKLLALANSSWFGVRNRVTTPLVAVNLLGLGTVRTLAISYCLAGLNHELRLTTEESRLFWAAALCKAVAARQYAQSKDPTVAEEAFACGLFQDFAAPIMYAVCGKPMLAIMNDASLDAQGRLKAEAALCGSDHAQLGEQLATQLELPEVFANAIALHHDSANLAGKLASPVLADAVHVAALFPHWPNVWNAADSRQLSTFLADRSRPRPIDPQQFLADVRRQFEQIFTYFEPEPVEVCPPDVMAAACRAAADGATRLVANVHQLMQQTASAGREVHHLLAEQSRLEVAATRDALTGALNRDGLKSGAAPLLAAPGHGVALVYLDIDGFKRLNDTLGHRAGDSALKSVASRAQAQIRPDDLLARVGGDEFIVVLANVDYAAAQQVAGRILAALAKRPISRKAKLTLSAGLAWSAGEPLPSLESLMCEADRLMYQAKRSGGNRMAAGIMPTTQAA